MPNLKQERRKMNPIQLLHFEAHVCKWKKISKSQIEDVTAPIKTDHIYHKIQISYNS